MYYIMVWQFLKQPQVLWYEESLEQAREMLKSYGPGYMIFKAIEGESSADVGW